MVTTWGYNGKEEDNGGRGQYIKAYLGIGRAGQGRAGLFEICKANMLGIHVMTGEEKVFTALEIPPHASIYPCYCFFFVLLEFALLDVCCVTKVRVWRRGHSNIDTIT